MKKLLNPAERMKIRSMTTRKRVETLIQPLMEKAGVEMWIVAGGDSNYEPVLCALLEEDPINRTFLIFWQKDGNFEKYQDYRFLPPEDSDPLYKPFLEKGENVYHGLERLIQEKKPNRIAVNTSEIFMGLDGITHTIYKHIREIADKEGAEVVSAEPIGLAYMQTRLPEELEHYKWSAEIARDLIAEALSPEIVKPGITTMADVHWHMVKRMNEMGLKFTWGPNVNSQRKGSDDPMIGGELGDDVILSGDLLHVDFGFEYLQLDTDMQYLAYVLKEGETDAPKGLVDGFEECRRFQQIYLDTIRPGITGNQLRKEILEKAEAAGMEAMVYSHPINYFVHGVGPCIGKFGIPADLPNGEYPILDYSCFAMEQNVRVTVPEWDNQKVFIFREEDIAVVDGKAKVIGELQPCLWLI